MSIIHLLAADFRVDFIAVEICKTARFSLTRLSMPFPKMFSSLSHKTQNFPNRLFQLLLPNVHANLFWHLQDSIKFKDCFNF